MSREIVANGLREQAKILREADTIEDGTLASCLFRIAGHLRDDNLYRKLCVMLQESADEALNKPNKSKLN